ncbi:MAG: phosphoadenylyl-sulfate reductase [Candidatus Thermoplasmatota archaeon]|nr:phosphoadenylyl-sulfate reductase [Candidatus Thermoplasmatota archaeon]
MDARENYLGIKRLLEKSMNIFDGNVVFLSSFGAEDMAILHVIVSEGFKIPIHTIDSGRLFQETYDLIEEVRNRYKVQVRMFFPDNLELESFVALKGPNSFYLSQENRHECCKVRKVEPLDRAIKGFKAWITGVRADQTSVRMLMNEIEPDPLHEGVFKINPLLRWKFPEVMSFLRECGVPYNPLIDQGFVSIGCRPCTRAIKPGEEERAGRWWWEQGTKECGLHIKRE